MIVLDTNVLSELLRPSPNEIVVAWLTGQSRAALFTTTVTRGEMLYGVRLLDEGQRRRRLWDATLAIFDEDLAGRVLAFDSAAADAYVEIAATRRLAGRPISQFDAMIAAITYSRGATLTTRNTRDFNDCGVAIIDPWTECG